MPIPQNLIPSSPARGQGRRSPIMLPPLPTIVGFDELARLDAEYRKSVDRYKTVSAELATAQHNQRRAEQIAEERVTDALLSGDDDVNGADIVTEINEAVTRLSSRARALANVIDDQARYLVAEFDRQTPKIDTALRALHAEVSTEYLAALGPVLKLGGRRENVRRRLEHVAAWPAHAGITSAMSTSSLDELKAFGDLTAPPPERQPAQLAHTGE